jgi:hypothetical protein
MTELFLNLDRPPDSLMADDLDLPSLAGLAGLVVDATRIAPAHCLPLPSPVAALYGAAPGPCTDWDHEAAPLRVVDQGLDACVRLRDAYPTLQWLPRLTAYRAEVSYRMSNYRGEGFSFYTPDPGTIQDYRVTDGDQALTVVLQRARALGFDRLWLHARDAAQLGNGLDLDLLECARCDFPQGLWISGGATELRHLENLTREGGVAGLVIGTQWLRRADIATLTQALTPPRPPEVPIAVAPPCAHVTG